METWVVISPHADDEVLGMGGVLMKYRNKVKWLIMYLYFTGYKKLSGMEIKSYDLMKAINRVAKILNAQYYVFRLNDYLPTRENINMLQKIIGAYNNIGRVYLPYWCGNQEHEATYRIGERVFRLRSDGRINYKELIIYFPEKTINAGINMIEKINWDDKLKLLEEYEFVFSEVGWLSKEQYYYAAKYHGNLIGEDYGEEFLRKFSIIR